jgi:hypothetical protein
MPALSVPAPTLRLAGNLATLEIPVEFFSPGPLLPGGSAFNQEHLGKAGFFVFRRAAGSASDEIWDLKVKVWRPSTDPLLTHLEPSPLLYKEETARWQGLLVAAGQKDKNDQDQFEKAALDFPRYFVRTFFAARNGAEPLAGLSGPSGTFRFVSLADTLKAGLRLGAGQTTENATQLTVFLRGGGEVRLLPSGDIELAPAPGRRIFLRGPLEAEEIFFQPGSPGSGGLKRWLT